MTPAETLFRAMQAHATAADQFTFEPGTPQLTIVGRFGGKFTRLVEVVHDGLPCGRVWLIRDGRGQWLPSDSVDDAVRDAFAAARKIPDGAVVVTEVGTLPGCEVRGELR